MVTKNNIFHPISSGLSTIIKKIYFYKFSSLINYYNGGIVFKKDFKY